LGEFHILVVDDASPSRLLITKVCSELMPQAKVEMVSSGQEALQQLESTPYDLMILDLGLPDISGLQVLGAIKEKGLDLSVVTISDESSQKYLVQSLDLGAKQYLTKPISKKQIISVFKEVLDIDQDERFKHALIVDDEKINLKLLSVMLQSNGFFATLAESGPEAIELNQKHNFDVILMDIRMPGMTGIEASEIIYGETPDVPIIAVTAEPLNSFSGDEIGIRAFHQKPVNNEGLLEMIGSEINKSVVSRSNG
jgi:CheY-like chemotaxis protein